MKKTKPASLPKKITCKACAHEMEEDEFIAALMVCPSCHKHFHISAKDRIEHMVDGGTFKEWFREMTSVDPLHFVDRVSYKERLLDAYRKTGLKEAVIVGRGKIAGKPAVFCFLDFEFMGGTMGSVVGEKIMRAFLKALELRLPVVSIVSSGGARMQEGMLSLMQMAKTSAAVAQHHREGLLYISVQTHPTTGGISASFSSLGDIIIAEPGALIGFVGPRVIEQTLGEKLPPESHSAEFLMSRGMIDLIVPRHDLKRTVSHLISHLTHLPAVHIHGKFPHPAASREMADAWNLVKLARHRDRPSSLFYIHRMIENFVELHGDCYFGDDHAIVGGVGEIEGNPCMVIAQEKGRTEEEKVFRRQGMAYPEGYRKAARLMNLAAKFHVPLITFIDTPGAYPGFEAEMRGIAKALAESLFTMSSLPVPVISVVIGEGGSGGALALALANRVLMQANAIYSVISPEGASAILWGDATKAQELAPYLKLTAHELKELEVIDEVIPEPGEGAHQAPDEAARLVKERILFHLFDLSRQTPKKLVRERFEKYRSMGETGVYWQELIKRELQIGIDKISKGWSSIWHKERFMVSTEDKGE
ncbi:MAG: acetyl-CoA carboxylase carboxyltransferase subunit alpha [Candidatus Eremiobacteraeota bacterium]|nr:acetyl-CoA carboxylase carboxyltransferase subunit alpha [Candidatus Eremiobacteraeota bacterium]